MSTRDMSRPAAALALSILIAPPLAAQSFALETGPADYRAPLPPAATYRITLASAWPQVNGAEVGCLNGGDEVVEGVLTRIGPDRYEGTFHRRTTLRFCGAHGSSGAACALVLYGDGAVRMTGLAIPDDRSPSGRTLRLSWAPEPGHGARTEGACAEGFKRKVEEMYLGVRHGVELALPVAGAAPRRERLEGYGWTARIE